MREEQLPTVGASIERAVQDWKVQPSDKSFELAKDVAAFANHLGGAIVVGAQEVDACLKAYVGLTPSKVGNVCASYSRAVKERCRPTPTYDFVDFASPGGTGRVVVVNVYPSLNLIGVEVNADKASGGYGGKAWTFPVRAGIDADYLKPEQLAMYMTPAVRRVSVLLSLVPAGDRVKVTILDQNRSLIWRFGEVKEEQNLVTFLNEDGQRPVHFPLDQIQTVFQNREGLWVVVMPRHMDG